MKYELARDLPTVKGAGVTLHRIRALRDIRPGVTAGDIGGFVATETNLSHEGKSWIYDDARVYGKALVHGNGSARNESQVFGSAEISEEAYVGGRARAFGDAWIRGDAKVLGDAQVPGGVVRSGAHYTLDSVVLFGKCDGYTRIVCQVDGVAYIGAGCRWFTIADAREHWGGHADGSRDTAMALLEGAANIARLRGWSEE